MDSTQDLVKVRDDVLRKIGRNLLNFQKIEHMLKLILANGRISSPMSEFQETHEKQKAYIHKQMMGNLVGQFIENTFLESLDSTDMPEAITEPHLTISFGISADAEFYENKKRALKLLIEDRNDLIHHLLPRFNSDSIESCLEIEKYLDEQRERLLPEFEYLAGIVKLMKEHFDFMGTEEASKLLELSFLQQSPLVLSLLDISIQQARSDGWTILDNADRQLRITLPDAMNNLKNRYVYKNLRELIVGSEVFDTFEEQTKKGGVRFLYRPKSLTEESALINVNGNPP
jgi:hypothetical protein